MTTAELIVDALLEGTSPEEFMQSHAKRWHAKYYRDENGWYHVSWMRGLEMVEADDLKLSKAQIGWLERYANWLDRPENMPYDAWLRRYVDPMGQDNDLSNSFSKWLERAQARHYLGQYQHDVEPELPDIKEPLPEAMSPEEFMRGHVDKWHFNVSGGEHWVILSAKKGLEDVGGFNTPRDMVGWYIGYLEWLDNKWPWESYRDAIGREGIGVVDWMNASFQRGFRGRYEDATGNKMPERRPERR